MENLDKLLHPLTARWFKGKFAGLTDPQKKAWPLISKGDNVLVSAPTGMGKTLTAFLMALDGLIRKQYKGEELGCEVIYISPLKALANDVHKNLTQPLSEISKLAESMGYPPINISVAVRSGDTPAHERRQMLTNKPQILITTPESFHILLCAEKSRELLKNVKLAIVDEIHAMLGDKRGAHLSLAMERLERLTEGPLQRIGLSATQKPIEKTARVLVGERFHPNGELNCQIVETALRRDLDLSIWVGDDVLGPVATHEYWAQIYDEILASIESHKSTIVFTHTRRLVERVSHQLSERLGKDKVAAHHGSLSKELRLSAEENLKSGKLSVIVASASLELGIDVGDVDLVLHIGCPRNIGSLIQRVGRSGHVIGKTPKGVIFPLTMDELLQSAASIHAVKNGVLDAALFQKSPLDVLAQTIVAECSTRDISLNELWSMVKKSFYYKDLPYKDFESVLHMLVEGVSTSRGKQSSYLHFDGVNKILSAKRNARLAVITSGGTIPEPAEYDVVVDGDNLFIGRINEDFAIESMAGNVFLLGNQSWQIIRVEKNKVRVKNANGALPNIPFWLGEAPARTMELSEEVSKLREKIESQRANKEELVLELKENYGLPDFAAEQIIAYVNDNIQILGAVPSQNTIIAERFFDEAGGLQLIIHAPFGARINRAWALALRKRFCLNFDFELQCAATDNAVLFSLSEKHSFPLDSIWQYLHPNSLEKDVTAAVLPHPIFNNRFRWNAARALSVLRFQNGKKVPIHLQRMKTEDVLASVFPAHVGCQDNRAGPIEPVDHPLVNETLENCFHEAMDIEGLKDVLQKILKGKIKTICKEPSHPSPFSYEILNASPYAFLDDAPLEERRSRAVNTRASQSVKDMGELPLDVVQQIVLEAIPEFRSANEFYEYLVSRGIVFLDEISTPFEEELLNKNRISKCYWGENSSYVGYSSVEKWKLCQIAFSNFSLERELPEPYLFQTANQREPSVIEAREYILKAFLELSGPTLPNNLSSKFGWSESEILNLLYSLESKGQVLFSLFGKTEKAWCSRNLAIRMHRRSLMRLRKSIEPINKNQFMDFLFRWQYIHPETKLKSPQIEKILWQYQGYDLALSHWLEHVFPSRLEDFNINDLEMCLYGGGWVWSKLKQGFVSEPDNSKSASINKTFGISFFNREKLSVFFNSSENFENEDDFGLGTMALEIFQLLKNKGAMFESQITSTLHLTDEELRKNFKNLIQKGLISSDGLSGLRKVLLPKVSTRRVSRTNSYRNKFQQKTLGSRWYLWQENLEGLQEEDSLEYWAFQLLNRYGILFRDLCNYEKIPFPWWKILRILQKMEAQGRVRGGLFVSGVIGEQFALPSALDVAKHAKNNTSEEPIIISAADPLNFTGMFLAHDRVPRSSKQFLVFVKGELVDVGPLGQIRSRLKNEKLKDNVGSQLSRI